MKVLQMWLKQGKYIILESTTITYILCIALLWSSVTPYFQALERLLPPRPHFELPVGEHVEEVELMEVDMSRSAHSGRRGEAYDEDEDDDEDHHGPRVQCAHQ